jgi:hypothetical protein
MDVHSLLVASSIVFALIAVQAGLLGVRNRVRNRLFPPAHVAGRRMSLHQASIPEPEE